MEQSEGVCRNCGAPLAGEYCSRCGERKMQRDHLKLSTFAANALEEITDLAHSKLLRTFKALIFQPGVLTNEYLRGRRKSYLGPVKIYLTIFAISFLLYSFYQPTSVYDLRTLVALDSSGSWQATIRRAALGSQLSEEVAIAELNARWRRYLQFTQAIYPLGIALLFQVFYFGARRYFAEHLIFALHFSSIALGVNILVWPIYVLTGLQISTSYAVTTSIMLLLMMLWLLIGSRRVYHTSWFGSAIKTIIVEAGYLVIGIFITLATLGLAFFTLGRWR